MSLDVKGRLIKKLPVVSGEGRNGKWEKQEFVIETTDQYPKKICMSLWGDKLSLLEKVQEGDMITVSVNIESREYNERWYTDVRAWRIQMDDDQGGLPPLPPEDLSAEPPLASEDEEGDLPF